MQQLIDDCRVMKEHNLKLTRSVVVSLMERRKVSKTMLEFRLQMQRKADVAPVLMSVVVFVLLAILYLRDDPKRRGLELFFALILFLCQMLLAAYLIRQERENKLLSELLTLID